MDPSRDDGYFTQLLQDGSFNNEFVMTTPTLTQSKNDLSSQIATGGSSKKSQKGPNFTQEEDLVLINGWLATSFDGIVANEQKSHTFWGRIHTYYHLECKRHKLKFQERSPRSLTSRWSVIQKSVNMFCGCLAQIENLKPSGCNEIRLRWQKLPTSKILTILSISSIVGKFYDIRINGFCAWMN